MSRRAHEKTVSNENQAGSPKGDRIAISMPRLTKAQVSALFIGILFLGSSAAFAFYSAPTDSNSDLPEHISQAQGMLDDPRVGPLGGIHEHFAIAVTLDGVPMDFSRAKYQLRDKRFHFESGDGSTGHMHATGITLNYTFTTLGMKLSSECFVLDTGREFCNTDDKQLEMLVNGRTNTEFEKYAPKEGDQIVIIYG